VPIKDRLQIKGLDNSGVAGREPPDWSSKQTLAAQTDGRAHDPPYTSAQTNGWRTEPPLHICANERVAHGTTPTHLRKTDGRRTDPAYPSALS